MISLVKDFYGVKKSVRLSREELNSQRLKLLKEQLISAYENVPFYTASFKNMGIKPYDLEDFNELKNYPIITKEDIQKNSEQFLNRKVNQNRCYRSHSSGSTGRPLWVSYSKDYWFRKKYFSKLRARMECGYRPGEKTAIFEAEPTESLSAKNKKLHLLRPWLNIHYFSIFERVEYTIPKLKALQAINFYGPPSFFVSIAQIISEKNISFTGPNRIFTSSEYLELNKRNYLSRIFNAEIFDVYGCTEIKEVAWECQAHEGYHINEDEVIVEIINGQSNVEAGEVGGIILTDLRNKTMPLIRYQIQDHGMVISHQCSCGRTFSLMKPVAGRLSENIVLPNGENISPYQFTTAVEKIAGLQQYQIIQETEDRLRVNVILNDPDKEAPLNEIRQILKLCTHNTVDIQVNLCNKINVEENGKFKVVKSMLQEA